MPENMIGWIVHNQIIIPYTHICVYVLARNQFGGQTLNFISCIIYLFFSYCGTIHQFFLSIGGGPVRNQHPPNNTCNLGRSPRRVSQQPNPLIHYWGIAGPNFNARLISRSLVHKPTHSGSLKPAGQSSQNYISSMCPCVLNWGSNSGWGGSQSCIRANSTTWVG